MYNIRRLTTRLNVPADVFQKITHNADMSLIRRGASYGGEERAQLRVALQRAPTVRSSVPPRGRQ